MSEEIIPDPDFEGFNGVFCGDNSFPRISMPPIYNMGEIAAYLREHNKKGTELTKAEIKQFNIGYPDLKSKVKMRLWKLLWDFKYKVLEGQQYIE